ncbi:MAG: hypothetical protein KDB04_01155 [Acidimicrobiales bacterium]|nr:hypothetical protein [Acidimicrobiales bacterium]
MPDPVRPSPTELAELAHRSTVDAVGPSLIHLRLDDGAASLELGVGPLPADRHPADALVGFRAPDAWDAVGIATTGVVHDLPPMACAGRGRFTTLAFRDRTSATVIERDDGRVDVLEGAPVGWVVDVLRRVLGLPADPPEGSTAVLVDTWWLDTLVSGVLTRAGRAPSWRWAARRHPLCPPSGVPSPEELAARTAAEALARPWSRLRGLLTGHDLPAEATALPYGQVVPGRDWFDDGSLSRWMLRVAEPPEVLLGELVERLPAHLLDQVLLGLAEIDLGVLAA